MGRRSMYSEEQWAWVADRYRDGYTIYELADFLDMSYSMVAVHMRRFGVMRASFEKPSLRDRAREFNELGHMAQYMKEG